MLYLIGIGLSDEKDISVKGLEIVKKADKVYLENYTSRLSVSVDSLEKFYGQKVIIADREMIEQGQDDIISSAKDKDVVLLIIGDVFSATTHTNYLVGAKEKGVDIEIIYNSSILTAVGVTGLQLYKFGKVTSIPFNNGKVDEPIKVLEENTKMGLHTLFLLDLDPSQDRYMTIKEALDFLISKGVSDDMVCVGCARLGSRDFVVKKGTVKDLVKQDFGKGPYCLIIPGKMHFMEEEAMELWD